MVLSKKNFLKPVCTPGSVTKQSKEVSCTKMKVYIRVRPTNERERNSDFRSIIRLVDSRMLVFDPRESDQPFFFHGVKQRMRDITKKQNKEMQFVFDQVYGTANSNEDVYNGSICNIFSSLLDGYNCSVFVYGATGAGKTYTMLGNGDAPGIIYLTMRSLYSEIEQLEDRHFDIGISYLEVYNENVHDLLNPSSGPLHLREDPINGVIVAGMKVVQIANAEHLFELLRQGNEHRTQHPTDANAESSRSHAVFQVFIKMQAKDCQKVQLVKLSMIDLAGSERGAATNCKGLRFKEGANINKSLLALGNCINNLADGVRHIPYRDSKLTRLLKDSLGGNCQTVMIACVGPTTLSYEDTYNTLKYAARASTIKTKIAKTVLPMDTHINHYKILVQELQTKIAAMEKELEDIKKSPLRPRAGDLPVWIEKIDTLYSTKRNIHQELLSLESKEKILRWRIKYKHSNAARIYAFDNSDDEEFSRIETSVSRMEGTLSGLRTRMLELWDSKIEINEKLTILRDEIEKENLTEELSAQIIKQEANISEIENHLQIAHQSKLLKFIDITNEKQETIITRMAEQYNQHHIILRGFNQVTNSMVGEHKDLKSMLKGNHTITWEVSPGKQLDRLKQYATLSIDLLHTDVRPCPLIIPDVKEELLDENPAPKSLTVEENKCETDEVNATFVVPEPVAPSIPANKPRFNNTFTKHTKSPRRTPLCGVKKVAMKENKQLPSAPKRQPIACMPIRKHPTTPMFKTPKVPLAAKNQNVK